MSLNDVINITLGILASIGGGAGLVLILAKYFGNLWAKKYLETHKNNLKEQFENEKRQIELEFEKSKNKYLKYSNKQFELYNSLWIQLVELKDKAEILWEEASMKNLKQFAQTLKNTKTAVEKSVLFLEDEHYNDLMELLKEFSEYEIGKQKLIEYRNSENNDNLIQAGLREQIFIRANENRKELYELILNRISESFKSQLRSTTT